MAKKLTVAAAVQDLKGAYQAKHGLIKRQKEDHLFALGEQWSAEDKGKLELMGLKPVVDNRIAPNIFLLTGLERQNRAEFKAFPEGDEDGLKAEIATLLFKDTIKKSNYLYKSSEQFKDGIICGEAHLELYLDFSESLINGKACWHKIDSDCLFPDEASREYDFSDARFVNKITYDIAEDDLISLFPKKKSVIEKSAGGKLDLGLAGDNGESHRQRRDYDTRNGSSNGSPNAVPDDKRFDLVERYYKKVVPKVYVGDLETGEMTEVESTDIAEGFIAKYRSDIEADQMAYEEAIRQAQSQNFMAAQSAAAGEMAMPPAQMPPPPQEQDPDRFKVIERRVTEIWCFAFAAGIDEPLSDEVAWCYPKWKGYPFVPYFARFSTAPLTGDDRHLLVQGLVHGVKGVQEKHNKAEMLMLRHLNTTTNSGWLAEEDSWVEPEKVKTFGSMPGVNLEYKRGSQKPERIQPSQLSTGHAAISAESAESIKAQLGINADLLATQQGGADSGRAIALRQKQGLLMVQELFDNLSRSRQLAGRIVLSQLGDIYDTETAKKVLGDNFLRRAFPPLMLAQLDPATGAPTQAPMTDPKTGQPMVYDSEMADLAISQVLAGDLWNYDVSVGEAVASETQKMSVALEMKDISAAYPGLVPPEILVRYSQLPESAKTEIVSAFKAQQEAAMAAAGAGAPHGAPPQAPKPGPGSKKGESA